MDRQPYSSGRYVIGPECIVAYGMVLAIALAVGAVVLLIGRLA